MPAEELSGIELDWIICQDGSWCSLETVNLQHECLNDFEGVYIIWHGGKVPRTVRVGQGIIRDRLSEHRSNPKITRYNKYGLLYVTWAYVDGRYCDNVENYLGHLLQPLEPFAGQRFPECIPKPVNLPWDGFPE